MAWLGLVGWFGYIASGSIRCRWHGWVWWSGLGILSLAVSGEGGMAGFGGVVWVYCLWQHPLLYL